MAFWGVVVSPHRWRSIQIDETRRLHISRATLGAETSRSSPSKKNYVECWVSSSSHSKKNMVDPNRETTVSCLRVCCLKPDKEESCSLHIEFDGGHDEVSFSVHGTRRVHLAGYFVDRGCVTDSYTEDTVESDINTSSDYSSGDSRDSEYCETPDDEDYTETVSPKKPGSGGVIEKILDKEKPANEYNFPTSSQSKGKDERKKSNKESSNKKKKKAEDAGSDLVMGTKKKYQDGETERSVATDNIALEDASEKKKKKKKAEMKPRQKWSNPNEVGIQVLNKGNEKKAFRGNEVYVHFTGRLQNDKIVESNTDGEPFHFRLCAGEVMKGWDVGIKGMRIGEKRRLTIPPSMGYGAKQMGQIPPNSYLVFDVELKDVR